MWDVDDSGCINLTEMTNIIATMDDVEGVEQDPKPGQLFSRLSARMRAKEIFDRLDVNGDGELTKTGKIRRKFVQERYQNLYDALYDETISEKDVEASFQYQDGQSTSVKTNIKFYTVKGV